MLLSLFGVAMVYSAGQTDTPTAVADVYKSQIVWLLIGMVGRLRDQPLLGPVHRVDDDVPLYLLSILLLALTLVIGAGRRHRGEHEELARDRRRSHRPAVGDREGHRRADAREGPCESARDRRNRCSTCGSPRSSSAFRGLIIMLQPDLGTGIVFIGIFFGMLYWSGVAWPLLLLLASPVVSLDSLVQHRTVGRVVLRPARARAVLPAVPHRRHRADGR